MVTEKPVFPPRVDEKSVARIRDELKRVLELPEAELLRLIPERSGLYFVGCPNCEGGAQENQISWTQERPDEVFCRFCGLRYPNERFPDDKVLRVENSRGEVQEYPYWESAEGYRFFFRAKGWFLARAYFADAAYKLAQLYYATGDRTYARRSALILDRFAQVYPGYCVHYDMPFRRKIIFPGTQGFPYPVSDYRAAKWTWWAYSDIPENLIRAYDLIRDSGELNDAMKQRIEADFFRASVAFVRSYPQVLGNMDPTLLRGMIVAGRVLGEPDYIHDAVDWMARLIERQFFFDGMWREGAVSYHNQTVRGLEQLIELLEGYSDPVGFVPPGGEKRFEHLNLREQLPMLERAKRVPELLRYPNGRVVAFHDTWAREVGEPTETSTPLLMPGVGHARLGRGRGPHQIQVHLHFSGGYGHQHADLLSMTLFAHGKERLSDIGYTHTRHRCWTRSTLSHNTVMVDGQDQELGSESQPSDGNLLLYVPGDEMFQAVEASGDRAYLGVIRTYRRLLLLIGVSTEAAYVVDIFRVAGGNRHEYALLGDAGHDGALESDLNPSRYGATLLPPDVPVRLPTGESVPGDAGGHNVAYAFVRDVRCVRPSGAWMARFTSEGAPQGTVRIHGFSEPGAALFFGSAPSIRRAGEDDAKLDDFAMPVLIQRREGEDLSSTFVSVLEPCSERSFITSVERVPLSGGGPGDVALKIAWGDGVTGGSRTDYLICGSGDEDRSLCVGDMVLQGRIGFVRERKGEVERMTLVGGTVLEKGAHRLRGEGVVSGRIVAVLRKTRGDAVDGLVMDRRMSADDRLVGRTAIVKDGAGFTYGYEVAGVEDREDRTILALTCDPGFEMDPDGTSHHCFFPGRLWRGGNRCEIANVTTGVFP